MNRSTTPSTPRWERAAWWAGCALIGLAVFSGFFYVHSFGVNLYRWDEWDVLPALFQRYFEGEWSASDFWELHNEHRIVFPKLILFGLGLPSRGNTLPNMYATEVLLTCILAWFLAAFHRQFPRDWMIWLMVPPAFLVFSLRQHENMLWGFQVGFVLVAAAAQCTFFCLAVVQKQLEARPPSAVQNRSGQPGATVLHGPKYFLDNGLCRRENRRAAVWFAAAGLSGTVAAYSSIQGLLVWPIGLGQLLIAPIAKRRKIILTTAWSVIGAAEWLAYFYHYVKPAHHPELGFSWNHWVMSIGGALTGRATPARFCGLLILASMVAAIVLTVKHRAWSEHSFWLATVFFSLAVLGSITIGRSGYGAAQALSSRYATYSIPLWIAVYAMLASFHRNRIHRFAAPWAAVLFMAMLIGSGVSFVDGWETGRIHRNLQKYQQFVICTIDAQPDALIQTAAPNRIDVVRRYVPVLKKLQFNVFSDPALYERFQMPDPSLPVLETPTRFGLENIGPVSDGKVLLIQGWAVDWPAREPAGGVAVLLDGIAYPAYYGLQSDNAVQTLGSRKYLFSGFRCAIASKNVRPGKHTLSFRILDRDRKAVFAPSEPYVFQTE